MKVYLVRNFHTKNLLGLFWAETQQDLWWEVDGSADPAHYEYTPLRHGGLYFHDKEPSLEQTPPEDPKDPVAIDLWQPKQIPWSKAIPSDWLWDALHDNADIRFRRFPYADEPGGGVDEVVKKHGPKIGAAR